MDHWVGTKKLLFAPPIIRLPISEIFKLKMFVMCNDLDTLNTAPIIVRSQTRRIISWQLSIKMASYICHMYMHIYMCLTKKCLLLVVVGVEFRQRFMLENIEINRFNHQEDDMIKLFL